MNELSGAGFQGIPRMEQIVSVNLMDSDVEPSLPAGLVWGRLNKETISSANTSIQDRASLPSLALKPDNSVLPCVSLELLELLSNASE